MREEVESERVEIRPARSSNVMRRVSIYAALMLIAFLAGFVPMWLKARESGNKLAAVERTLSSVRLQNAIAAASLDAGRGDYEPARQATSQFYTSLRADIDRGDDSSFTPAQREAAQALFAGRDEIITLLARGDPAAANRLSDVYASFRKIVNG
ncbi:MAG TPA: hypothetical protein VEX70_01425 [Pyrinomonadaceae bacterium]|nr:hypothetical protein [Pyrinomonadaceae bacterium]